MKISLLSPVYNEERYLKEMLASLLAQTHRDWEMLLVDDGSTDGTARIALNAAQRDERIHLVSQGRKLGKVEAFNAAYRQAKGDLIAIVGGDDILPPDSLQLRVLALAKHAPLESAAAFFKLRMISDDPKFDGITLPRGRRGSRSGPSLTMSRPLADRLFPIPSELISEDIWLGEAAEDVASHVIEHPGIVALYRVHHGNSNPRHKSFEEMNESMHARLQAWPRLLSEPNLQLSDRKRARLRALCKIESHRYQGDTTRILFIRGVPIIDRLAMAAMSSPTLYHIRRKFYKSLSGWRGR